ncbi:MAG: hypothetical protein GY856_17080 [bacterium]|nr:hypothetical protein [bacterium]
MIQLIANTKTRTGLRIQAELDSGIYPTGIKVSDEVFDALCIQRDEFHGDCPCSLPGQTRANCDTLQARGT